MFPEKLAIAMWNSLVDKGIGGFLKPYQMKREAKAKEEIRIEMAKTKALIKEMKKKNNSEDLYFPGNRDDKDLESLQPYIDMSIVSDVISKDMILDRLNEEINVASAILNAEGLLLGSGSIGNETESVNDLDEDWLIKWRDKAAKTSSEDLQMLWGRILAGEVQSPGLFSYRTLDFLSSITFEEAVLIGRLKELVINDVFVFNSSSNGIAMSSPLAPVLSSFEVAELEEMGIITQIATGGMIFSDSINSGTKNLYTFRCNDLAVELRRGSSPVETFVIHVYPLTKIGRELMKLSDVKANQDAFMHFCMHFRTLGFDVTVWNVEDVDHKTVRKYNPRKFA